MYARRLMYLPAAALLAWGVLAAAGVFVTADSRAASSGSTSVTAQVLPNLTIGGDCIGGSFTTATMSVSDAAVPLAQCTVTQTTNNNAAGTTLLIQSTRPTSVAFCKTVAGSDCALAAFTESALATSQGATLADGNFAVRVNGAPTCSAPVWTNTNYYSLRPANVAPGNGDPICTTVQATPGSYALSFEANPLANQEAGNYIAAANFTVEAA
ncbi:MAG: hypothetical protein JWM90_1731 [Thermoleophilia bacterium]|nr:hypothetical protein [Thermoleophilia bacterium]